MLPDTCLVQHKAIADQIAKARKLATSRSEQALLVLDTAIQAAEGKFSDLTAIALAAKANYYSTVVNDIPTAQSLCNQAFGYVTDHASIANAYCHSSQGVIHHFQGDSTEAQDHYLKSILIFEQQPNLSQEEEERLATLYLNNFNLFSYTEDEYANTEHLQKALAIYKRLGIKRGEANCYISFANYHSNVEQKFWISYDYISKAIVVANEISDDSILINCHYNAANYCTFLGEFDNAIYHLEEAEKHLSRVNSLFYKATMCHQAGLCHLHMMHFNKAVTEFLEAEKHYNTFGAKHELGKLWNLLAGAYSGIGNWQMAYEYSCLYASYLAENNGKERHLAITKMKASFENQLREIETKLLREKNAEIQKYVLRLENSNNDLQQFANVVSHDLREPLRMIHSYMNLLERGLKNKLSVEQEQFFHFAVDGAKRLDNMINELLRLAKADADPNITNVSLEQLMREVEMNLHDMLRRKSGFISFAQLPTIKGDSTQLLQVFQNLVSNGLKYNESKQPTVEVTAITTGNKIQISVHDNGIGIAKEQQQKVFGIFQRASTKKEYEGIGMGLAICKKIIESMEGQITIEESRLGGTCFVIELPIHLLVNNL